MATAPSNLSFLATSRGRLTLAVLCAVAFLDFVDASIINLALPAIRHDLHVSIQNLQWVPSGYLLTYGGFMLLGGRAADLLGRRRVLVAGTFLFGASSLAGGLASNSGTVIGSRLAQGIGAAMMLPAALSILTTTFTDGPERHKALGAWGGMAGLGSAAAAAIFLLAASLFALRTTSTRGEPQAVSLDAVRPAAADDLTNRPSRTPSGQPERT